MQFFGEGDSFFHVMSANELNVWYKGYCEIILSYLNTIQNKAKLFSPWLSFEPPRNIRASKLSSASIET